MTAAQVAECERSNKFLVTSVKRLRSLKKKLRHIEELKVQQKALQPEEQLMVSQEAGLQASILELEKLHIQLIDVALLPVLIQKL